MLKVGIKIELKIENLNARNRKNAQVQVSVLKWAIIFVYFTSRSNDNNTIVTTNLREKSSRLISDDNANICL